jgi:hypothetical protein
MQFVNTGRLVTTDPQEELPYWLTLAPVRALPLVECSRNDLG